MGLTTWGFHLYWEKTRAHSSHTARCCMVHISVSEHICHSHGEPSWLHTRWLVLCLRAAALCTPSRTAFQLLWHHQMLTSVEVSLQELQGKPVRHTGEHLIFRVCSTLGQPMWVFQGWYHIARSKNTPTSNIRAGQYINIVSCHHVTDFGYRYIVIWQKCCLFLGGKASKQ